MIALILALTSLANDPATQTRLWWGDWNADGRLDVVRSIPGTPPRLLENRGAGAFADISEAAGWPALADLDQVVFADLDGDGAPELVLVAGGRVRLFERHGEGLVEGTEAAGLAALAGVAELRSIDVDGDGVPELWLTAPGGERVLRRTQGGAFEELDLGLPPSLPAPLASIPSTAPAGEEEPAPPAPPAPGADEGPPPPGTGPGSAGTGGAGALSAQRGPRATSGSFQQEDPSGVWSLAFCGPFLSDSSTGNCLQASSTPTLGHLYPLSNALNVSPAGNVGMGTTAPTHKLTIRAGGTDDVLRLMGKQGLFQHGARLNFGDGDYVRLSETLDDQLEIKALAGLSILATSGSMTVDATYGTNFSSGNVGIGQPTPIWALDVQKPQAVGRFVTQTSTNGSVIELRNQIAAPALVGALNFVNSAGQTKGQVAYTGGDDLTFRVNNIERARIYASGDVVLQGPLTDNIVTAGSVAYFTNQSTAQYSGGIQSTSNGPDGSGVLGLAVTGTGTGKGVHGITGSASGYGVFSIGDFGGTGAKYFVQPHPADASKEIRFVSLEGNESGTYFRGRARTVGGQAAIEVPEDFRLVTEAEGLTVQTTPIGAPAVLWIESQDLDRIVVRSNVDVEFSYFANGVRRGFAGLETIRDNDAFVPRERGVPYGTQYPADYRRILVENGTLEPDFTPNEATAARLGWTLTNPAPSALETASGLDSQQP